MSLEERIWIGASVFAGLWLLLVRTARHDPRLYWQLEYVFGPLIAVNAVIAFLMGALLGSPAQEVAPDHPRIVLEFIQVTAMVLIALLISRSFFRMVARMPPPNPNEDRLAIERDRPRYGRRS